MITRLFSIVAQAALLPSLVSAAITINSDQPVDNTISPQFYKYNQTAAYWAVTAIRSDTITDWNIELYSDTLFSNLCAGSSYRSGYVDFVLSDYNHSPTGWQGIKVNQYSGNSPCRIEYEDGINSISAPGNSGNLAWPSNHIAHAWDVYLTSGQTYTFTLINISGAVDYGIALFQSNGSAYYAGRSAAVLNSDHSGPGQDETFTITASNSDFYGLVVWANNTEAGSFQIAIQTLPELLHDHPLYISDSPHFRKFNQNRLNWETIAARPDNGSDYDLYLYSDTLFNSSIAISNLGEGYVDFVVGDQNHSPLGWYGAAAVQHGGSGGCRLEYEDATDLLSAPGTTTTQTWPARHVAHIWDVHLNAGETWTFALNNLSGNVNFGIGLFKSNGSAYYAGRSDAEMLADAFGPGGSEIISYTASTSDYYGFIVWANNDETGNFTIGIQHLPVLISTNPFNNFADPQYYIYNQNAIHWATAGVRPETGSDWDIIMYSDTLFANQVALSSNWGYVVDFVVGDYNHAPLGWEGIRLNRSSGDGECQIEYAGSADILPFGTSQFVWPNNGHVVAVWDIYLNSGQPLFISAMPSSGLDIGVALFKSNGSAYYVGRNDALQLADEGGEGWIESCVYVATQNDSYGLILWNNNGAGGTVNFNVTTTGIDDEVSAIPADYSLAQNYPNPFNTQTTIEYALPEASDVIINIYDLLGKKIETLVDTKEQAGYHRTIWNTGSLPSGIYFYGIKAGSFTETRKMVVLK